MTSRNEELFARAQRTIPGGVNSPVRAFRSVGGTPRFLKKALGARVWDADGKEYLDYVGSWGPAILGHADPVVVEAVRSAALEGLSFGAPTEREIDMAERLCERMQHAVIFADMRSALPHITGSFGVASLAAEQDDEALIAAADAALYRAKASGRNRVST